MEPEVFNKKFEIAQTAVNVYVKQPDSYFIHDVALKLNTNSDYIYQYFKNRWEILDFYYASLVTRYRLMTSEIDDYNDFTLAEKLSNFAYSTLGMMQEQEKFFTKTFNRFVLNPTNKPPFQTEVELLFQDFIEQDALTGNLQNILAGNGGYTTLAREYFRIISFWLEDDSKNTEKTQALIDKWSRFIEELFYSKIIDSGLDLTKYIMQNQMTSTGFSFIGELVLAPFRRK